MSQTLWNSFRALDAAYISLIKKLAEKLAETEEEIASLNHVYNIYKDAREEYMRECGRPVPFRGITLYATVVRHMDGTLYAEPYPTMEELITSFKKWYSMYDKDRKNIYAAMSGTTPEPLPVLSDSEIVTLILNRPKLNRQRPART